MIIYLLIDKILGLNDQYWEKMYIKYDYANNYSLNEFKMFA